MRSNVSRLSDLDTLFGVVTTQLGNMDVLFAYAGIAKFAPAWRCLRGLFRRRWGFARCSFHPTAGAPRLRCTHVQPGTGDNCFVLKMSGLSVVEVSHGFSNLHSLRQRY